MKDEKQVTMKNGQKALSGICTTCGTKMFRIGGGGVKKVVKATAKEGKKRNSESQSKSKSKKQKKVDTVTRK